MKHPGRHAGVPRGADKQTVEFGGADAALPAPGELLAERFEVVQVLAQGGMGIILEARDQALEGLRVALKLLPEEMTRNKGAQKRLRREALAAIQLAHPNVARLHSLEEDGERLFLVMEFLDGEDLDTVLAERERLPLEEVREIARDAVAGLRAAHDQDVIHRDVKPANLMYGAVGKRRVVKVTDFGISHQVKDSMTRLTGLVSAGTLLYCPPEQLANERPDARGDQYSLAATLYELLTGEPPLTPPALEHKILNVDPKPIEGLPEAVNRALLRALAKDPADRFEDLGAFLAAFEGEEGEEGSPGGEAPVAPVEENGATAPSEAPEADTAPTEEETPMVEGVDADAGEPPESESEPASAPPSSEASPARHHVPTAGERVRVQLLWFLRSLLIVYLFFRACLLFVFPFLEQFMRSLP